jgi:antitoxin (DNA-binding transcriptional repressor) of toxin-antitoxin stability system
VIIAKAGRPVVRLVPFTRGAFKVGLLKDHLTGAPDFLEPLDEETPGLWEGGG